MHTPITQSTPSASGRITCPPGCGRQPGFWERRVLDAAAERFAMLMPRALAEKIDRALSEQRYPDALFMAWALDRAAAHANHISMDPGHDH